MDKNFSLILTMVFLKIVCGRISDDTYNKYKFKYSTGDKGAHSRTEESNALGHVSGMYQYKDPNGLLRIVQYQSSPELGFQAYASGIPFIETNPSKTVFEYSINSDHAVGIIPKTVQRINSTSSAKHSKSTPASVVNIPLIQPFLKTIPVQAKKDTKKPILLGELESNEIKNIQLPAQDHKKASNESESKNITTVENSQELGMVNITKTNSTVQFKNETEKRQEQANVENQTILFPNYHDMDFKFAPPSYPFRFYKIPIVPIVAFPHTLPIITPTFRYAL